MRRFELQDGTSSKFWQVSVQEKRLRVQFGKIGSHGQVQIKDLASESAAETEMEKLIKEKVKKGYSETGGDEASAPAAHAAPPPQKPAAPEPVKEAPRVAKATPGSIVWTDAAKREASPIRGSDVIAARLPDVKTSYATLTKAMKGFGPLIEHGKTKSGAQKELMSAAQAAFAGDTAPPTLEVDSQAAAYALVGPKTEWTDGPRMDTFVRYWIAKEGGAFALRALARAQELHSAHGDESIALVPEKQVEQWWRSRVPYPWRPLRVAAVLADAREHAALLETAHALAQNGTKEARAMLATAFERPEWSDDDMATFGPEAGTFALLAAMPDLAQAKALADRIRTASAWQATRLLAELRYDLVARYGIGAASLLQNNVAADTGDDARSIGAALALIVTDEVAEYFVKQLGVKELREIAVGFLQAHPSLSIMPLTRAGVAKGAVAETAKAVLKTIVASSPEEVAAVRPSLPPNAQHLLAQLAEQLSAKPDASAEALPRVLREPPWRVAIKTVAPIVVALSPLSLPSLPESMAWEPGEEPKDERAPELRELPPDVVAQKVAKVKATSESAPVPNERSWNMVNASILTELPTKELLDLAPTLNLGRFSWSYYAVAEKLIEKHGIAAIDLVLQTASVDAVTAVHALRRASSPRVAPLMADALLRLKKAREDAVDWLIAFPEAAAVGLIPQALGKPGKAREAAEGALRLVSLRGHRAIVEEVAKKYGKEAEGGVRTVLDFDPLRVFPSKLPKMPGFWSAGAFTRPLLTGGKTALPLAAVDALGTMLAFTEQESPYPGIAEVKAACDARSLGDFAWDLFQAWLMAGASSKEQWAFLALAHLGDDECARRLTPLVRAWPGEAAHARAVVGLEVLARIGTDVALMHLHGIAQKLKFKGLQEKAREKIDHIAEARGLTAEELADRLVPDLGLDDGGSLALDFGPRSFRVTFDEALKPLVMDDETGKRLPDLPKAKQTDDAEKAKEATEVWKALKKDARTIATTQLARLETAMCGERRWTRDVFQQFLVEHPLLIHVVRRVVWATYDGTGKPAQSFRVAEDSSFASATDDAVELADDASVGIVHRFDLDDKQAAAWGQILSDYEIIQPFAQLSREISRATDADKAAKKLERWVGLALPTGKVLGLDARGWRRGPPQDAGVVGWYEKPAPGGMVVCLDLEPGIYTGMISESPEQKLGILTLHKGAVGWSRQESLAFGALSPIGWSEMLRDLDSLRS